MQKTMEKENFLSELDIANKELLFQNIEKEKRAAELIIADKELLFQNKEKGKRAAELIIANKELLFQIEEKEKKIAELFIANKELLFQIEEKEKIAAELIILKNSLFTEKQILKKTLISIGDGVICTDKNYNVTFINRVTESVTGWTQKEAFGKSIYDIFNIINEFTRKKSGNIIKKVMLSGKIHLLANHNILITRNGKEVLIEDSVAPFLDDTNTVVGVIIVFSDYTEKRKRLKKIEFLVQCDQLTGLYNRGFYERKLKSIDTKKNLPLTIVMSDLNGLKLINDTFGHAIGDELLKKIAKVMKKAFRPDDIIARFGGDEFIAILPKTDAYETEKIIKRIKLLLSNETIENIHVSISFGYETKNNMNENLQEIFKKAENNMYKRKLFESPSIRGNTINAILNTLFEKNKREEQHSQRVSALCISIGEALGLSQQKIEELKTGGLLHDIGKIAIAESILNKPGKLSEDEFKEIKRHPEIGYRILKSANDLSEIAVYVLSHHERWDGKGYPRGLKGNDIPFESRIIAVADAYDAMTSERSYREALPEKVVLEELHKNAGSQFDPDIVRLFVEKVLDKEWA